MKIIHCVLASICLWAVGPGAAAAQDAAKQKVAFQIDAPSMTQALLQFTQQSNLQLAFASGRPTGLSAPKVVGEYTPKEALERLLAKTGLRYEFVNERTVRIVSVPKEGATQSEEDTFLLARADAGAAAQAPAGVILPETPAAADAEAEDMKGIPEILVRGRNSLNADIARTEDGPQPYVVFSQEDIQRSQSVNLEEFLKTRLPMNTASSSLSQTSTDGRNQSNINLRGLGTNETLILVDGRRIPGVVASGNPSQPDINGIPISAIERVEVLPSGAGGIYGGSATGGVVNIILRRDYQNIDTRVTYANTFDTDAARRRVDLSGGFNLEGGRTRITVAASASDANVLSMGDRDFSARAIQLQLDNNRSAIDSMTTPPLGSTVNIRSVNGSNLVLDSRFGGAALLSPITSLPMGYAGPASDNGAALVARAGRYNVDLPLSVLGAERGILTAPSQTSFSLNVRREFTDWLEIFLDASKFSNTGESLNAGVSPNLVNSLHADAPNNPFTTAIRIRFPTPGMSFPFSTESGTLRGNLGFIATLPMGWMAQFDYGWSRSRVEMVGTGFVTDTISSCVMTRGIGAGATLPGVFNSPCMAGDTRPAINALQEANTFPIDFGPYMLPTPNNFSGPYDTTLKNSNLRISGPVLRLPAGNLNLTVLAEKRHEAIENSIYQTMNGQTGAAVYYQYPYRAQGTDSYYAEARMPLMKAGIVPWVRELEVQASVRHDRYRTRGVPGGSSAIVPSRDGPFPAYYYATNKLQSTDETVALRFVPVEGVALRASYSTAFLPPSVNQITESTYPTTASLGLDRRRGDNPTNSAAQTVTIIAGGNSFLGPETSENRSVGMILTPKGWLEGVRLSVDYSWIDKINEIQTPSTQFLLDNEVVYADRIVREAGPRPGEPSTWAGPIIRFDQSLLNVADTQVEAMDLQLDFTRETQNLGDFRWYVIATQQTEYADRTLPTAAQVERSGFSGGPLEWRGNVGVDWRRGALSLGWNMQYYDAYWAFSPTANQASRDLARLNQGSYKIPSQSYHDIIATWRLEKIVPFASGLFGDSEISVGIQNVFDRSPPILASTDPASIGYSTYGDPRLRRYSISFRKQFGLQ